MSVVQPLGLGYTLGDFDQPLGGVSQIAFSSFGRTQQMNMMPPRKANPRAEYRLREIQRVNESVSLAAKFPKLKSLKVDLTYFAPDGLTRTGEMRYKVNVEHAKSVFSFVCQSGECLAGDFDLSNAVAEAVAKNRKAVEGEIRCQGKQVRPKE